MIISNHVDSPPKAKENVTRRDSAKQQIIHYIRVHQIKPGEKLPTIRAFCDHLKISRDATWRGLRELKKDGWIRDLPMRRYTVADAVHTEILRSLRLRAIFSGDKYIYFSGFRRLADALKAQCLQQGLDLSIKLLPLNEPPSESIWKNCDVLLVDSDSSSSLLKQFKEFPVPVVGLDADYSDRYRTNLVTDHQLGGRLAAERLIQKGSKRVCVPFFKGSGDNPRVKARIEGFMQTWIETGRGADNLSIVPIEWSSSSFEVSVKVHEFLKRLDKLSDFFATDGHLAISFLEVLCYMGVDFPSRSKLIGYDAAQMGALTDPPMTTVQQDMEAIAKAAIERIVDFAHPTGKRGEVLRIPPVLVKRFSC